MRPTTMAGASAAEDGGTITTAARKHNSNPIQLFIFLIVFLQYLEIFLNEAAILRILRAPGLPQSEKACYEKHHNNDTDDVKDIVHVTFSSLSYDRITFNLQF